MKGRKRKNGRYKNDRDEKYSNYKRLCVCVCVCVCVKQRLVIDRIVKIIDKREH